VITAIVQARMGSTRLPSKTLADVAGKTLLERVIDRAHVIPRVEQVILATTELPEDDVLLTIAERCGVGVFRGSVDDVLLRFAGAAATADASVVVRITADDPFKDPKVCGLVLDEYLKRVPNIDYVSNTLEPTWPEGLDVEVFSREALDKASAEAKLQSEREHVTPYIYKNPQIFRILEVRHTENLSAMRWTLDYPEDLDFARAVYERLRGTGMFGFTEILDLLAREPELQKINTGFTRNAGYLASLAKDTAQ
jgi:spore coat polysaccharide biosynthesis protein SpsF